MTIGVALAVFGAAIAACAGVGSGLGVGIAGEAADGVMAGEGTSFGSTLVLQALPGTQGIYGMVIAIMIMTKIGVLGGGAIDLSVAQGLALLGAGLPIGIVGVWSGIAQGKAAAAGIQLVSKKDGKLGQAIIYAVMVETYAILAFIISFLLYNGITV
ncbi:MAG: V-type ATP synthase subunit K [Clostridiales bacterium]|nr:V-type ATP synthase subunit K [Candidatus Crickella caballi]